MKFPSSVLLCAVFVSPSTFAETVNVAVASNFADTALALATVFESETGHELRVVRGSTGMLYAQTVNGAPFDVFLSADSERPALLEREKKAVTGSRFTYAIGQLVVWSRDPVLQGRDCVDALHHPGTNKVAIANPDLAPYGRAARDYLIEQNLWEHIESKLVFGENIAQTFQFVASGNAQVGIVARAQVLHSLAPNSSCEFAVPENEDSGVEQQAVILTRASDLVAAREFTEFLQSESAAAIIRQRGYRVPKGNK